MIIFSIALVVLFSVILRIILWINAHLSLRKKLELIPGPKTLPFIGLIFELQKIPTDHLFKWTMDLCFQHKNGMVITWIGTEPTIHLRKPNQLEVVLRSHTLIKKSRIYDFLAYWLGNGLLTSTGDIWHKNRRLITPAFHFNILDEFTEIISNKVDILNASLKSLTEKFPKKPINVFPLAIKFTLDTVCQTVMGVDMDLQRQQENEYVKALHKFAELTIFRFMRIWFRSDIIFYLTEKGREYRESIKKMHDFTMKVIHEKGTARKTNKIVDDKVSESDDFGTGRRNTKAFLDLLMDLNEADENPLNLNEIREQVDTFMFGGHDTTGIAISYILFCLGNAPDVQRKVQEEMDFVVNDSDEPLSKQQLSQLKYLDRVIKESMRLYPSAPSVSRVLDHDVSIDNYILPKGITVSLQILQLHRDPEIWENPEKFDPDRFLPENAHGRHPYAYLPFSAGPRNCIGQKFALLVLKIALTAILRKWTITSELKMEDMQLSAQIVLGPPNETINLYFEARDKQEPL